MSVSVEVHSRREHQAIGRQRDHGRTCDRAKASGDLLCEVPLGARTGPSETGSRLTLLQARLLLRVDAAKGESAVLTNTIGPHLDGVELADSVEIDAHK
jgi:hypothetical protein